MLEVSRGSKLAESCARRAVPCCRKVHKQFRRQGSFRYGLPLVFVRAFLSWHPPFSQQAMDETSGVREAGLLQFEALTTVLHIM